MIEENVTLERIAALETFVQGDLRPDQVSQIATKLGVLDEEVISLF